MRKRVFALLLTSVVVIVGVIFMFPVAKKAARNHAAVKKHRTYRNAH